ncbi:MAG: ATPase, T2SS/T4P/T4SS family [Candidatus Thermoplasmatota archaeon]
MESRTGMPSDSSSLATSEADHDLKRKFSSIFQSYQRVKPKFSSSWVVLRPPPGAEKVKEYLVEETKITLYRLPGETETLYHLEPLEYTLPPGQKKIISLAREEILDHYPGREKGHRPTFIREYAKKQGHRLIYKYANLEEVNLGRTRSEELARVRMLSNILSRYTVGLGIVEILLRDTRTTDVYIDAPVEESQIYTIISSTDLEDTVPSKCVTNIALTKESADSIISRLQYESGRAFSEARPVLECSLPEYKTRATVIGEPLSPEGVSITFRRHSPNPWTLLRLIYQGSLSPLAAGLLSFLIDGNATLLIAGPRSAGKTSLAAALMFEFAPSQRIVTIEDTLELPCSALKEEGYKVQSMHVQSSGMGSLGEMSAEDSLRVSLRLGESAIVMGEVRGEEARTLYEAMRAGTAGSAVMGTIHADSPKAVYERVVYDLNIPPKSFAATDGVVMCNYRRPKGLHRLVRKTTQISEVVKDEIPATVDADVGLDRGRDLFNDLMLYSAENDTLEKTEYFGEASEILTEIADDWEMSIEEAEENIRARALIKSAVVDRAREEDRLELLEADYVPEYNTKFWQLLENQMEVYGGVDYDELVKNWKEWFQESF